MWRCKLVLRISRSNVVWLRLWQCLGLARVAWSHQYSLEVALQKVAERREEIDGRALNKLSLGSPDLLLCLTALYQSVSCGQTINKKKIRTKSFFSQLQSAAYHRLLQARIHSQSRSWIDPEVHDCSFVSGLSSPVFHTRTPLFGHLQIIN